MDWTLFVQILPGKPEDGISCRVSHAKLSPCPDYEKKYEFLPQESQECLRPRVFPTLRASNTNWKELSLP
jgi:hypothetical protein